MSTKAKLERLQRSMAADGQDFFSEVQMHTFMLLAMGVGGLMAGFGIGFAVAQHFLI